MRNRKLALLLATSLVLTGCSLGGNTVTPVSSTDEQTQQSPQALVHRMSVLRGSRS